MDNPFSLTFSKEVNNYIDRINEKELIISIFTSKNPSNYTYLLTGVRGCGKTVFMYAMSMIIG